MFDRIARSFRLNASLFGFVLLVILIIVSTSVNMFSNSNVASYQKAYAEQLTLFKSNNSRSILHTTNTSDIYVVWRDDTPGDSDIFFRASNQTFNSPINISNNTGDSEQSQIAIASLG